MDCGRLLAGVLALAVLSNAPAASARITPFFRAEYSGAQLKMEEGNQIIDGNADAMRAMGFRPVFQHVRPAYGPSASAGFWLTPSIRIGATASYQRSVTENHMHVPGAYFFAQDLDFRVTEFGGEAALRVKKWAGFHVGGSIARCRARLIEGYTEQSGFGDYFEDSVAERTKTVYGTFIGIEQTEPTGVAGYLRLGYQFRNMGSMPSALTISDGVTTTYATGQSVPLDYSGWYAKAGFGFDIGW